MLYDYLICGLRVRFLLPWPLKVTAESTAFLISENPPGLPDFTVDFVAVDRLSVPERGGIWYENSYYLTSEKQCRIWHCPIRGDAPYCCVIWNRHSSHGATCYYVQGQEKNIVFTKNLLEILGLEAFLLRFDGLILHASLICWEGRGILFSAPSGTGKSTQAALWERYMHSRTLNGDRAGIRCDQGIWKAWGIPFAGTSGIYRNESAPICAMVLLRQGEQNRITPVQPLEAFKRLLPECNAQRWDADFMNRLVGTLSGLAGGVPVYQLECRPDYSAVELLRDAILKEA